MSDTEPLSSRIQPEGHFASVNGMEMYYEIHGEGSPLVLLHGFTGSTLDWEPFIGDFAQHFKLVVNARFRSPDCSVGYNILPGKIEIKS